MSMLQHDRTDSLFPLYERITTEYGINPLGTEDRSPSVIYFCRWSDYDLSNSAPSYLLGEEGWIC